MKLYDECLNETNELLSKFPSKINYNPSLCKDAGKNQLLFKSDTAYELGGRNLPAISSAFFTDDIDKLNKNEVVLYGPDLADISADAPYARIALVRLDGEKANSGENLYLTIRKIEYTRYHLNPLGYMMRISSMSHRECVRIGKEALKEGLSFFGVGKMFVNAYLQHDGVANVKMIFITEPDFPYDKLSEITMKSENITKALDHLVNKVNMDCNVCSLKEICSEVEELCNKDFDS